MSNVALRQISREELREASTIDAMIDMMEKHIEEARDGKHKQRFEYAHDGTGHSRKLEYMSPELGIRVYSSIVDTLKARLVELGVDPKTVNQM